MQPWKWLLIQSALFFVAGVCFSAAIVSGPWQWWWALAIPAVFVSSGTTLFLGLRARRREISAASPSTAPKR